jgi:hypothetical protein
MRMPIGKAVGTWFGLALAAAAGCSSSSGGAHDAGGDGRDANANACAALAGHTFSSVAEMECGLTPDGAASCHWTIRFATDGTYSWSYSDVGQSGTYACSGASVMGTRTGSPAVSGSYDAQTGQLTWDGVVYVPT